MKSVLPEVFTFLISVFSSLVVAYFTVVLNLKNHIKTVFFEKQQAVYIKFIDLLLSIKQNPFLQFNHSTINKLQEIQAEYAIFADKKCLVDFLEIQKKITELWEQYKFDNELLQDDVVDKTPDERQERFEEYKQEHKIDDSELKEKIEIACKHMKKSFMKFYTLSFR